MTDKSATSATDEAGSSPIPDDRAKGPRSFLAVGNRDLSAEDLSTRAAQRFLIAEIQRLDDECTSHKQIRDENLDLRVSLARLQAGSKKSKSNSILTFICSTIGSVGIGAAPSYLTGSGAIFWTGIGITAGSLILIIAGIAGRRDQDA